MNELPPDPPQIETLRLSGGVADLLRCQVERSDGTLPLTEREVVLLRYFSDHPHRAISRRELLTEVWGYAAKARSRATDNAIVRLRTKVEASPETPVNILSVRGIGYRFEPLGDVDEAMAARLVDPEPTSFVGRDEVLNQLADRVAHGRLVTLVGPPGIGKTRLAHRFAGSWPGRVWVVDLSGAVSLSGVVHCVAAALDIDLKEDQEPGQAVVQLGRALAARSPGLLVLDNLEHLVGLAAETLADWLRMATECTLLATSRERLQITGEHCVELGPLDRAEARQLFVDRARAAAPDFDPSGSNQAPLDDIVTQLDGLPLALELAAARVHVLPLETLAGRLRDLRSPRRDTVARHRTLEVALRSSWQLLTPVERTALHQCALFEGAFDLDAAEAVVRVESDTLDVLSSLRDKSMVSMHRQRYRLLGPIRAFVRAEPFATDATTQAGIRHSAWCRDQVERLAAEIDGANAERASRALSEWLSDCVASIRRDTPDRPHTGVSLLLALERTPLLSALPELRRSLVSALLARADALSDDLRVRLVCVQADLERTRAAPAAAIEILDQESGALDDPVLRAEVALTRATALEELGRREDGAALLVPAVEALDPDGHDALHARLRLQLGRLYFDPTHPERADAEFQLAYQMARRAGNRQIEVQVVSNLGVMCLGRRAFAEAHTWFRRALDVARRMGQMNSVAVNLIHLGIVFPYLDTRVAQRDRVIAGLMEAIEVSTGLGRVTLQVASRQALMQIHLDADEIEEGLAIAAGLPERWADVAPIQQATVACTLAGLAQLGGESVRAESAFRQAVRAFSESGHTGYVWRAECFLALLLYELDRPDEADRLLVQAMTGDGSDVRVWLEDIRVLSGSLYRQRGAEGSGAAGDDEERLARIREGRGLESLQTPIQTTRAWVERMLARATARVER